MKQAHKYQNSLLSATFGQFMLFKREAYEKIGGHEEIKDIPIDDFTLGRAAKLQTPPTGPEPAVTE